MGKAVPYSSRSKVPFYALALSVLVVSACARSAPELPPDYGSVNATAKLSASDFDAADLRTTCLGIDAQQDALTEEASSLTGVIKGNRQHNQVAGYLGGMFLLPALAAKENPAEKSRLDEIQARWDKLVQLERFKNCGAPAG